MAYSEEVKKKMRARVTLTFSEETVNTFAEIFGIEDYSKIPEALKALLKASISSLEDESDEELDDLTVEMIE